MNISEKIAEAVKAFTQTVTAVGPLVDGEVKTFEMTFGATPNVIYLGKKEFYLLEHYPYVNDGCIYETSLLGPTEVQGLKIVQVSLYNWLQVAYVEGAK